MTSGIVSQEVSNRFPPVEMLFDLSQVHACLKRSLHGYSTLVERSRAREHLFRANLVHSGRQMLMWTGDYQRASLAAPGDISVFVPG